jgi:hypothetical protein
MALRNIIAGGAVVLATGLGTVGVASAATNHSTPTLNVKLPHGLGERPGDGGAFPDGPGGSPLSAAALTSAQAAASAAVPNATLQHAFQGPNSTYVVIMEKSDGTYVTVIENSSFVVTSTHNGAGPRHGDGPGGSPLSAAALTSAQAAASAAVPNATLQHAFPGPNSTYVVIMEKSDGTYVTVIENSSFVVTSTQAGLPTPPVGAVGGKPQPDGSSSGDVTGSSNR